MAVAALTFALVTAMEQTTFTPRMQYVVAVGVPALIAFGFSRQPGRFGLAMGAILTVAAIFGSSRGHTVHSERTFFGVHRVAVDLSGAYHQLLHGGTIHGVQSRDPARRREPLGYFSASGPAGQILGSLVQRPARIGVVGLGNGTLAAYAGRGESWTFFEIDGAVERIARDPRWFTYLADSPGDIRVLLGDGRLSLAAAAERYDVLILDAYSSEAIPLHLLSREAVRVYRARLAPGGVLVFHISNRYFDLAPVVAGLAQDAGLEWRVRKDEISDPEEIRRGSIPSTWAVLTSDAAALRDLATDRRWRRVPPNGGDVWTDDYSSLLSALR
jgi:SAM-dependent methyltransferase